MSKGSKLVRVSPEFDDYAQDLRAQLKAQTGREVTNAEITRALAELYQTQGPKVVVVVGEQPKRPGRQSLFRV